MKRTLTTSLSIRVASFVIINLSDTSLLGIGHLLRLRPHFLSGPNAFVAFDDDLVAFFEVAQNGDPGALGGTELDWSRANRGFVATRSRNEYHRGSAAEDDGVFGNQN